MPHPSLLYRTVLGSCITPSQWREIESVQTIGIRTIASMRSFVNNSILLNSTNLKSVQNSIRLQSKAMFYKTFFSTYNHIRLLGQTISPFHQTKPSNANYTKLTDQSTNLNKTQCFLN